MRFEKYFPLSLAAAGALGLLLLALTASAVSAQAPRGPAIRLQAGTFYPARGQAAPVSGALALEAFPANARGYYIVQFKGAVGTAWKQALEATGAEILDYIPDFAYKVRADSGQLGAIRGLPNLAWVGVFQPGFKLSPSLLRGGTAAYRVRIEQGADVNAAVAGIEATGAQVIDVDEDVVEVAASFEQLVSIARVLDVAWVENSVRFVKHNEYGGGVIIGANTANTNGYDGSTQIVAVADTGLGNGTKNGAHPDIPAGRIVAIKNWPGKADICFSKIKDDGAVDVDSGHGTHTSGSVLSDGGASGEGKGVAPAAQLVFQATENWATLNSICRGPGDPTGGYFLVGLPSQLKNLFQQAYDLGARVHSNSWGAAVNGDYTVSSQQADNFIWKHPDMTITFSAGNAGTDANKNGVTDFGSLGSPATAKNVISIGASENDRQGHYECDTNLNYKSHDLYQADKRCSQMGGENRLGTYGERYPADFPVNPLRNDKTAGNREQMAAWSSRGPADDGRIKPDVVAPGTWVLSTYSLMYQQGYGDPKNPQNNEYQLDGWGMPMNEFYKYFGGTSMSNPLVAGAAALVRDYFQKSQAHNASAALVKAMLINSAVDMLDENNDGYNDNKFPIPNNHEGWGRVNVAAATDGTRYTLDETNGIVTKEKRDIVYQAPGNHVFKVTLVWSDFPSTESASRNLVNNLNLVVISPSGSVYKGNVFAKGWSRAKGTADAVNNVENVFIQNAEMGDWTVRIAGKNVPQGPQDYALVIDGGG